VPGLDRLLGDGRLRQWVAELLDPHGGRLSTARPDPFLTSVVLFSGHNGPN
jgi:hypothetical protein